MSSSTDQLLLSEEQMVAKLYDVDSMMQVNGVVADGFVILLSNGTSSPKNGNGKSKKNKKNAKNNSKKKKNDNSLAFMALTSGNVLDVCFGVTTSNRRDNTPARRDAQAAKDLLERCATTDSFRETAVKAYNDAFKIIVIHDEEISKLNCLTRCFRARKIRKETEVKLQSAFSKLAKAVGENR